MRTSISLLLGLMLGMGLYSFPANAQSSRIFGTVVDASTGEPLPGANVALAGTSTGAAADLNGRYVIRPVPLGELTLVASYVGYRRQQLTVTVGEEPLELHIQLVWEGGIGEDVVVTAQAAGQISAINQQLQANTITNIVSRDRIQELPDVNAAESIGRLPGVSIERSGGEANKVAIRGLSPKYNTVTVNGIRVPSTDGQDRSVDLSLISSNMLDGIEVMKAITPDKDGDAVGGSVDLKLREAPERLLVDVLLQGGYNEVQRVYSNYKFAGSVGNRFFGSRLGVIASMNLDEYDRSADQFNARYGLLQSGTELRPRTESVSLIESSNVRGRVGGSVVLDYRIPSGKIMGNTFYNTITGQQGVRRNEYNRERRERTYTMSRYLTTTSVLTSALSVEQDFRAVKYDAAVAITRSLRRNPDNFFWGFREEDALDPALYGLFPTPQELVDAARTNANPELSLSRTGLDNISVGSGRLQEQELTFQANVQVPYRLTRQIQGYVKAGGKYRTMSRSNAQDQMGAGLWYGAGAPMRNAIALAIPELGLTPPVAGQIPMSLLLDTYARSNFLRGYPGRWTLGYTFDRAVAERMTATLAQANYFQPDAWNTIGNDYEGEERISAGYVMGELRLGQWLTFLPGIRWEHGYSHYTGVFMRETPSAQTLNFQDTTATRRHTHALPMVHLRIKPARAIDLRFAYTQTLTRPDFRQYAPTTFVNQYLTWIRAGNPDLRPAQSTNYDIALSLHQRHLGLFTVAGFYKEITDLIHWTSFRLVSGQQILPDLRIPGLTGVPQVDVDVNNRFPAYFRGVEVDWQTNLWYLPQPLTGIVLNANYTRIHSETKYPQYLAPSVWNPQTRRFERVLVDTFRVGRMPNQPQHIANVAVGYDYRGFSGRLSFLFQSNTLRSLATQPANDQFTEDYFRIDASVKQNLRRGLQLFANFNNLNNRADQQYQSELGPGGNPTFIEIYGFTMDVGLRYRL